VKQFLSESKVKREELFITTKVADHLHEPDDVEYSCTDSLKKMQLDYVDLLLCHWPIALEKESRESGFKKDANGEVYCLSQLHKRLDTNACSTSRSYTNH